MSVLLGALVNGNAISNRRKDHKGELSIYLPSNLFGIFMQNYKMFIGTSVTAGSHIA